MGNDLTNIEKLEVFLRIIWCLRKKLYDFVSGDLNDRDIIEVVEGASTDNNNFRKSENKTL